MTFRLFFGFLFVGHAVMAQCDSLKVVEELKAADREVWGDIHKAFQLSRDAAAKYRNSSPFCEGRSLYVLGKALWANGDYAEAVSTLDTCIQKARLANDREIIARSFLVVANSYYFQAYYDSAEQFFLKSKEMFGSINHRTGQIEVLHDMALMFHRKGDFSASVKTLLESEDLKEMEPDFVHYLGDFTSFSNYFIDTLYYREEIADEKKSLAAFRKSGNKEGIYQSLLNLGIAHRELGEHLASARDFVKACELMSSLGFYPFWDSPAHAYSMLGMEDSAFYYHYKALGEFPKATKLKKSYTYERLGTAHFKFGNLDSAWWYFQKAIDLNQQCNNRITVAGMYLKLARVSLAKKRMTETENFTAKGIALAKQVSVRHLVDLYRFAKDYHEGKGEATAALRFADLYQALTDSINRQDNALALIRFQAVFKTSKKERELEEAKSANLKQELLLNRRNNILISLAIISVLSMGFIGTLVVQRQRIKRQNQQLAESNAEQKALIQEIHHRVKNNLQYIVSMLSLQIQHIHNPELVDEMEEIKTRILTIGIIHERLYKSTSSQFIELRGFITELVQNLFNALPTRVPVRKNLFIEPIRIDLETAISIGLMINELVTNSIKHAFVNHPDPAFYLSMRQEEGGMTIEVKDNGPGFHLKEKDRAGFGLRLIELFLRKLHGSMAAPDANTLQIKVRLEGDSQIALSVDRNSAR